MVDLNTEEGALAFCEEKRNEMRELFLEQGQFECNGFSFKGYIFVRRDPPKAKGNDGCPTTWPKGPLLDAPEAVEIKLPVFMHTLIPEARHTEAFRHCVDTMLDRCDGFGWVLMAEQWLAHVEAEPGETQEQARARMPNRLEEYAGRREALMVRLEHRSAGERSWIAEIHRDPLRLGEWKAQEGYSGTARSPSLKWT